jgi:cytoskeleton protein RodZ
MLDAIEDDRFERLPGGVFAKSFVRQYAHLLGLDEDELAAEVQRMYQPPQAASDDAERTPEVPSIHVPRVEAWQSASDARIQWGSWLPALALVIVVMLVCSAVYSWWQRSRRTVAAHAAPTVVAQSAPATRVPEPTPPQPSAEQPVPAPPPAPVSQPPAAAVQQPPAPPEVAPPKSEINSADRPAVDPLKPAPANVAVAPPVSNPNAPVRVQLVASEPVWVLAKSDGKYSFSGTLEPNETRSVDANSNVVLRLGNAGGVMVMLNGKPLPELGPKGQVREIQLTPGGFKIVAAPKPSEPL